ncbi:hypothetical protein T05_8911 [Trichinella murrelli]|uniref:Uncharacterized protein n=1 Tax=Trichinella murrelli TaxID=144512 RepID=A0A0V0U672_9BILA|nr:hypothetical protein T05_8911 [Trichinella murrelli]
MIPNVHNVVVGVIFAYDHHDKIGTGKKQFDKNSQIFFNSQLEHDLRMRTANLSNNVLLLQRVNVQVKQADVAVDDVLGRFSETRIGKSHCAVVVDIESGKRRQHVNQQALQHAQQTILPLGQRQQIIDTAVARGEYQALPLQHFLPLAAGNFLGVATHTDKRIHLRAEMVVGLGHQTLAAERVQRFGQVDVSQDVAGGAGHQKAQIGPVDEKFDSQHFVRTRVATDQRQRLVLFLVAQQRDAEERVRGESQIANRRHLMHVDLQVEKRNADQSVVLVLPDVHFLTHAGQQTTPYEHLFAVVEHGANGQITLQAAGRTFGLQLDLLAGGDVFEFVEIQLGSRHRQPSVGRVELQFELLHGGIDKVRRLAVERLELLVVADQSDHLVAGHLLASGQRVRVTFHQVDDEVGRPAEFHLHRRDRPVEVELGRQRADPHHAVGGEVGERPQLLGAAVGGEGDHWTVDVHRVQAQIALFGQEAKIRISAADEQARVAGDIFKRRQLPRRCFVR